LKERDRERAVNAVKQACERVGHYRQPFGYGVLPLFDDDNGLISFGEETKPTIQQIFRTKDHDINDEAIFSAFGDSKTGSAKRMRQMPGHCTFDIQEIDEIAALEQVVSPSLVVTKNSNKEVHPKEVRHDTHTHTHTHTHTLSLSLSLSLSPCLVSLLSLSLARF